MAMTDNYYCACSRQRVNIKFLSESHSVVYIHVSSLGYIHIHVCYTRYAHSNVWLGLTIR